MKIFEDTLFVVTISFLIVIVGVTGVALGVHYLGGGHEKEKALEKIQMELPTKEHQKVIKTMKGDVLVFKDENKTCYLYVGRKKAGLSCLKD